MKEKGTMQTETRPIGAMGIIHVLKDINARFKKASDSWPQGVVPTVGDAEYIEVPCDLCDQVGKRYVGTHGPDQKYGPMLYSTCPTCGGTKVKERHPFPKKIVKLAKLLEHQDRLTIARTLAGLCLGFKAE